jgi:hypothetical protein
MFYAATRFFVAIIYWNTAVQIDKIIIYLHSHCIHTLQPLGKCFFLRIWPYNFSVQLLHKAHIASINTLQVKVEIHV